jgi:hypothetical protein
MSFTQRIDKSLLTKFHVPFEGAKKLQKDIEELEKKELNDQQFGHYKTTHKIDYPGYNSGLYSDAHRNPENGTKKSIEPPAKSQFSTTAGTDYSWKDYSKEEPIRSGTASGQRKNNPHPHEAFIKWKLNKNKLFIDPGMASKLGDEDKLLKEIFKDQGHSTYQMDFQDNSSNIKEMRRTAEYELESWKNPPQAPKTNSRKNEQNRWKENIAQEFSSDQHISTNRMTYGKPIHHEDLDDNTTRYGCNQKKMISAKGAVPTVIQYNHDHQNSTTSYRHQFGKRS